MKKIGILVLVIGLIGLIATLGVDTSVASSYGKRVHNIGLMNEKQNFLLVFVTMTIIGAILWALGNRDTNFLSESPIASTRDMRKCPSCAELVRAEAVRCRFCQQELSPISSLSPLPQTDEHLKDKCVEDYQKLVDRGTITIPEAVKVVLYIIGICILVVILIKSMR